LGQRTKALSQRSRARGIEARAEDEGELVAQVRRHAWEAHAISLSEEQALLLALRGELNETAWLRRPARKPSCDTSRVTFSEGKE
jgi:hypothetical protein